MRLKTGLLLKIQRGRSFALTWMILVTLLGGMSHALARSYAAIIVDGASGKTMHARAADRPRHPASLTKLMTAYLTFEALQQGRVKLSDTVTVSSKAARQPASSFISNRATV